MYERNKEGLRANDWSQSDPPFLRVFANAVETAPGLFCSPFVPAMRDDVIVTNLWRREDGSTRTFFRNDGANQDRPVL